MARAFKSEKTPVAKTGIRAIDVIKAGAAGLGALTWTALQARRTGPGQAGRQSWSWKESGTPRGAGAAQQRHETPETVHARGPNGIPHNKRPKDGAQVWHALGEIREGA